MFGVEHHVRRLLSDQAVAEEVRVNNEHMRAHAHTASTRITDVFDASVSLADLCVFNAWFRVVSIGRSFVSCFHPS